MPARRSPVRIWVWSLLLAGACGSLAWGADLFARAVRHGDPADQAACLADLEARDWAFLRGVHGMDKGLELSPADWARLRGRMERGEPDALALGFRLGLVLEGPPETGILRALGTAMQDHPAAFLAGLQGLLDLARQQGQSGALKERYWHVFTETDFGYGEGLAGEAQDMRRREGILRQASVPQVREALTYLLSVLEEKIRELPPDAE